LTKSLENFKINNISNLQSMMRNSYFNRLLLLLGFWMLIAANAAGQGCVTNIRISFFQNCCGLSFNDNLTIQACGDIGPAQNDIDIWSTTTTGGNPTGLVREWEWSNDPSFAAGTYNIDPYPGTQYVISSFSTKIGLTYFRLKVTSNGCGAVYSNIATLTVTGNPPAPPTTTGASRCNAGTVTLTAAGCSNIHWFNQEFAGTDLHTGASYTTSSLSTTTTFWAECRTNSNNSFGYCESPRTPAIATIGVPPPLGTITGPATVCPGQAGVAYSVPNFTGMTYAWNYSGTGATITGTGNAITITFTAGATSGNLTVTGTTSCGTSSATPLTISVTGMAPPVIGTITQPDCSVSTGSILLTGLPTGSGTWTVTQTPGGTFTGTTATYLVTGLAAGTTYTFTVSAGACTSLSSDNAPINTAPTPATAPLVGTIGNATCSTPGKVLLNGLP
jgi:hypothetical protein